MISPEPGYYAFRFDTSIFNTPELDHDFFLPDAEFFPGHDGDLLQVLRLHWQPSRRMITVTTMKELSLTTQQSKSTAVPSCR